MANRGSAPDPEAFGEYPYLGETVLRGCFSPLNHVQW